MSLSQAAQVKQTSSHTYTADFSPIWTIGTVPHGGYVTSCIQRVVALHFATTLRKQKQPHIMTLHLDFLRRTDVGPAKFEVKDIKLGRQASVVHVMLSQDGREEVVGYVTCTDLATESGVSHPTHWSLNPAPLPVADFEQLDRGKDDHFAERLDWPFSDFRKATQHIRAFFPRRGQHSAACIDQWMCLREPGAKWKTVDLGFVVDMFPQIIETFAMDGLDPYSTAFEDRHPVPEQKEIMKERGAGGSWYPTVLLNLDVKKDLGEGVRWLMLRLQAKVIANGRYDLEIVILDAAGEVVALSHHVVLAVSAERNRAARRKANDKPASKL